MRGLRPPPSGAALSGPLSTVWVWAVEASHAGKPLSSNQPGGLTTLPLPNIPSLKVSKSSLKTIPREPPVIPQEEHPCLHEAVASFTEFIDSSQRCGVGWFVHHGHASP